MQGAEITVEWHVYADGRWLVETVPVGHTAPVSVYVTEERMAPVVYRHRCTECPGECVLPCGCTGRVSLGCDADDCVIRDEPRVISPYGADTLRQFSLD